MNRPLPDIGARRVIVGTLVFGILIGGLAFAYKMAEFIHTLSSPDFAGTFDVGITVYFVVAGGWLCLLVWCLLTGQWKKMESGKYDLIADEEAYERRGI